MGQNSQTTTGQIQESLEKIQEEYDNWRADMEAMLQARADEQQKIEDLRVAVLQKEREMEDDKTKGVPSSMYVNNCRANEAMVSPEAVKMINHILENDSPEALCEALEIFV